MIYGLAMMTVTTRCRISDFAKKMEYSKKKPPVPFLIGLITRNYLEGAVWVLK